MSLPIMDMSLDSACGEYSRALAMQRLNTCGCPSGATIRIIIDCVLVVARAFMDCMNCIVDYHQGAIIGRYKLAVAEGMAWRDLKRWCEKTTIPKIDAHMGNSTIWISSRQYHAGSGARTTGGKSTDNVGLSSDESVCALHRILPAS